MVDYVRVPNRDVINIASELADASEIEQYLFSEIGGMELINLVRNDSIAGITENYTVISDLLETQIAFDPSFILSSRRRGQSEFDRYSIKLSTRIPDTDFYDENDVKAEYNIGTNTYYDADTKQLVIELENMRENEFVEVEVLTAGRIYNVRENDYK